MADLSVLIPARNEMWLARTIEDVVAHITGETEVIAVLDGAWPTKGFELEQHPNVHVIYLPTAIGQRAATNLAARVSTAKYVMKLDGHCAVAPGFDTVLMESGEELGRLVTQIPAQHNLHVFDWLCDGCQKRIYQGPTPEPCHCGGTFSRDIVWSAKRRRTEFWRFDSELHFQYWGDYKARPEAAGDIVDVMTSLGACFFMARDRFHELGGLDEAHGSWGQFGVEVALKSMLSGGRHVVNKRTWFSHLFRTQGGDFSFPYTITGSDQDKARAYSRNLWLGNNWPMQTKSLKDVVRRFAPIPGWTQEQIDALPDLEHRRTRGDHGTDDGVDGARGAGTSARPVDLQIGRRPTKGIVYYSDCRGHEEVLQAARTRLKAVAPGPIAAVTLAPIPDFACNIVLPLERGYLAMFKQILAGLEALDTDYAFLCEHDVLYAKEHFDFTPPRDDTYYYNEHVYKVDADTGRTIHYRCSQTSGLCANRALLVAHYRKRVEMVERGGYTRGMGFEPGTHTRPERVDDFTAETWMSPIGNVDIRHGHNLTPTRWTADQFRNKKFCEGLIEVDAIPGWGKTLGVFSSFLATSCGVTAECPQAP